MLAARLLRAAQPSALRASTTARTFSTMAAATTRIHYDSTTCPYAQRSWIALLEKGLPFEIRKVDLANKDAEFIEVYQSVNPDKDAPAKVPILIDGDTRLIESSVIVDYLNQQYPEPPFLPADAAQAGKVRLFVETFSSQFIPAIFGLYRTDTAEAVEAGKQKLVAALKVLDAFITLHGTEEGGSYFLGGTYSLAEVCCTGFLQRGLATLPPFRGIDLRQLVASNGLTRLESWMNAALARPSAQQTKPSDEVLVQSMSKFVVPLKQEA